MAAMRETGLAAAGEGDGRERYLTHVMRGDWLRSGGGRRRGGRRRAVAVIRIHAGAGDGDNFRARAMPGYTRRVVLLREHRGGGLLYRKKYRVTGRPRLRLMHGLVGIGFAEGGSKRAGFRGLQRDEGACTTSGIGDCTQGAGLTE